MNSARRPQLRRNLSSYDMPGFLDVVPAVVDWVFGCWAGILTLLFDIVAVEGGEMNTKAMTVVVTRQGRRKIGGDEVR